MWSSTARRANTLWRPTTSKHAVANAFVVADMGDDESPLRTLVLGPDRTGNMQEVIVLHFDDGREMVIHAMPMRAHYRGLIPRPPET